MKIPALPLTCAAFAVILSASAQADSRTFPNYPAPDSRFSDALNEADLAREALMNTAPDGSKALRGPKVDASTKANVTVFGSIFNNQGAALCGLVLANGQFMFSCSPNGSYSLVVPQDASGQVTLFGFVDGHFPYRLIFGGSGGRYDMVLNVASSVVTPPPPPNNTITFTITDGCNNGVSINYKFYDMTNNLVWPSATSHYFTSAFNASYTHNLSCRAGANVCYGGRSGNFYWGVDVDGSKGCPDCCIACSNGNSLSRRLAC
jgi:hypothetical protein